MKFSLISATSIFALLSAAVGPAHAGVLSAAPDGLNLYDLVHDGVTSSDGGDGTVSRLDLSVSAVTALEASTNGLQTVGFTGRTNLSAGRAYPITPLGAAPGAKTDEDLASAIDTGQMATTRKAMAIGQERVASLIGSISSNPTTNEKTGGTVFVAEGSKMTFNDGGDAAGARNAFAFAPSSTSTATITVAGAGNFSRPGVGGGAYVAASNSLQVTPLTSVEPTKGLAMAETPRPTLGYYYAPAGSNTAKGGVVEASFSDAITASGNLAQVVPPIAATRIQTSQLQPGQQRAEQLLTSEIQQQQFQAATVGSKSPDMTAALLNPRDGGSVAGARTLISTSVAANPTMTAATYLATVIRGVPTGAAAPTVEAFQIGPRPGPENQKVASTTVSEPLRGKILASAGPLNSSLALP